MNIALNINNFRNIKAETIQISENFNFIFGDNASGKTSLLEAIYFLGTGKSFRCNNYKKLINFASQELTVAAKIISHPCNAITTTTIFADVSRGATTTLGVSKHHNGAATLKINAKEVSSFLEMAQVLPLQILNHDSYTLLDGEPLVRRKFLDWLLFHVEPGFVRVWQNYKRVLAQRNALLKGVGAQYRGGDSGFEANLEFWDNELCLYATLLQERRLLGLRLLQQQLNFLLAQHQEFSAISGFTFALVYKAAPYTKLEFSTCLKLARNADFRLKATTVGPHREDFAIFANNMEAKFVLSRGQIKLLVFALSLARELVLRADYGLYTQQDLAGSALVGVGSVSGLNHSLFLIDDLRAEFDNNSVETVYRVLQDLRVKSLITGVDPPPAASQAKYGMQLFYVEHGVIVS